MPCVFAYTDPEVAWVGLTEDQAKAQGIKVKKACSPGPHQAAPSANGRDEGVTKLLFDDSPEALGHGKILGGGMVGAVPLGSGLPIKQMHHCKT